jgi:hypothetical protein
MHALMQPILRVVKHIADSLEALGVRVPPQLDWPPRHCRVFISRGVRRPRPMDVPYEDCPRGRVNPFDATGRFTLLADKCIIKSKPLVRKIMAALGLPKDAEVVRDLHYRCAACMGKVPTRKQEKEDWDF